jgi:hypothetical protein
MDYPKREPSPVPIPQNQVQWIRDLRTLGTRKSLMLKQTRSKAGQLVKTMGQLTNADALLSALSNPYSALASVVATVGTFVVDSVGRGTLVLLGLTVTILLFGVYQEVRKASIYQHGAVPLPVVINVSNPAHSEGALNGLFAVLEQDRRFRHHQKNLAQYVQILPPDLVFDYRGDIHDAARLKNFLQVTRHDLERLKAKLQADTVIHLAYIGPASVGILVGTLLGLDGVVLYQFTKSSDTYRPVIEVSDRRLKEHIARYEKFEIQIPERTQPKVTVAIDVSSHKINLNAPSIRTYGDVIYLRSLSMGTIEPEEDWAQYCREVFAALNYAQQQYEDIQLVYSMPVALAIAIGIATRNYWNILLTNYDSQTGEYLPLIKLNDVSYHV